MSNRLYIPCTNALCQVSPVNYCILSYLINTLLRITELLIGDDLRTLLTDKSLLSSDA